MGIIKIKMNYDQRNSNKSQAEKPNFACCCCLPLKFGALLLIVLLAFFIFYIGISIGSVFGILGTLSGASSSVKGVGMAMDMASYLPVEAADLSKFAPQKYKDQA